MDARQLKATRITRRMTQAHLAQVAGVSERTIIRAERGHAIASESWRSICAALDVDASTPSIDGDPFADPIVPDVAAWHAANGFGIWATVGAASAAGCVLAIAVSLAAIAETDSPGVSAMGAAVALSSVASLAYVAVRARSYGRLAAALSTRRYGIAGDAVFVRSDEPATGISTTSRIGPCVSISEARPYALWPSASVARVTMSNGRTADLQAVKAPVLAARLRLAGMGSVPA